MPSAYFNNFPSRQYSLTTDAPPGSFDMVTDIMRRSAPINNLLTNKLLFYEYQVKDSDTPESIAYKYYGSTDYHWVISLINGFLDPLMEWPKNYENFIAYIVDKYGSVAQASSTIHHYIMTEIKMDSFGNSNTSVQLIDQAAYNTFTSVLPVVYTFSNGNTVMVNKTRGTVDAYTYEQTINESKRTIQLLKKEYLTQIVSELERTISAP